MRNEEQAASIAIIGGTGLNQLPDLQIVGERKVHTPYGEPSASIVFGRLSGQQVAFLARHGEGHKVPPHRINYRANIWALRETGVQQVIAIAAVGGIHARLAPGEVAIPDQIIDYTWGRAHTYSDGGSEGVQHAEFGRPYSEPLRQRLITAARPGKLAVLEEGVYGCTQGPRLETEAEIRKMQRDGCDMIGMTGMPEAALARELGLDYASVAVSVNWCAGLGGTGGIHDQIEQSIKTGMRKVQELLGLFLSVKFFQK